jgi:hypothetical protein
MRAAGLVPLVLAALAIVLGGCSGAASSSSPPTSSSAQGHTAEVVVHLEKGTPASKASRLPSLLVKLGGDITGTDWNHVSPNIVLVYLGSSETVAEIAGLLPTIRKMADVKGVTVRFE